MKLPNLRAAVVAEGKVVGYLLNPQHPDGAAKARFLAGLGFRTTNWRLLAGALRRIAAENEVALCAESPYGRKFVVDGQLTGPAGLSAMVRTVWIINRGQVAARLVTAYPCKKEHNDD